MLNTNLNGQNAVGFLRVSTSEQGNSKLGLEAQEKTIRDFCEREGMNLVTIVTEVISGTLKIEERKKLQKAIKLSKQQNAYLCVAKLDRLSRSVSQVSKLMDEGVPFISIDLGAHVDKFYLHIISAFAEAEAARISDRTKSALAARKARGHKLGSKNIKKVQEIGQKAIKDNANAYALEMKTLFTDLDKAGITSYTKKAEHLNKIGCRTRRNSTWTAGGVRRICLRLESL